MPVSCLLGTARGRSQPFCASGQLPTGPAHSFRPLFGLTAMAAALVSLSQLGKRTPRTLKNILEGEQHIRPPPTILTLTFLFCFLHSGQKAGGASGLVANERAETPLDPALGLSVLFLVTSILPRGWVVFALILLMGVSWSFDWIHPHFQM
uniref:Uncharacterized protein n=1 Tax=Myotis myotis TaxID=51298 RepID=A0A7J7Z5Z1_MYOMY|nr:hypothetical protein mMyoMyo1_010772 [Myotis myotis]